MANVNPPDHYLWRVENAMQQLQGYANSLGLRGMTTGSTDSIAANIVWSDYSQQFGIRPVSLGILSSPPPKNLPLRERLEREINDWCGGVLERA